MSSSIDQRVVQMEFDNSRFERNVSTSISTLDKLESKLKLSGASKSLDSIEKEINGFNLSGIGSAVETISGKFSALGIIGITALQNITNKAINTGERLVKSLSIDQITSGWGKYADKTTSVQTIMTATERTWKKSAESIGFTGTQMDFVNSQMDKLNWFTDETSYSFTDMVNNIGKFTSNNIPLETAVTAMQGIANWAAISGQNAGAASRAMYNLAQSIGVGSVKLMDWRSIENANMATAGFKERVLEVASANGQLKKEVDKTGKAIYKTKEGTEVTVENFSQTLSEGWFNKDTLLSVLDDYGAFTNQLYELSEASGLTATDILGLVEAQENGTLSTAALTKAAADAGMSVEEFDAKLKDLGSEENKFGRNAFKAAQEAKTFSDAIEATKDAASTKWMNIFENIFGDYEKARHVWTDFANFLYDVLVSPLEGLETITEYFSKWNGLDIIREGFGNIFAVLNGNDEVDGMFSSFKKGFQEIIPPLEITSYDVEKALYRFKNFAASLSLSEEQAAKFKQAGIGLANILKFIGNSIKNVWDATAELRSALGNLVGAVGNLILGMFGMADDMDTTGIKAEGFKMICDKVAEVINVIADAIRTVDFGKLKEQLSGVTGVLSTVFKVFNWVIDKITSINFGESFGKAIDWIKEKFQSLKDFLSGFDFGKIFKGGLGAGILGLLGAKTVGAIKNISEPLKFLTDIKEKFEKIPESIGKILNGVSSSLKAFTMKTNAEAFKSIATGLLLLAGALLVLGLVNYENAVVGVALMAGVLAGLFAAFKAVGKIDKGKMVLLASSMLMAAGAMLVMAVSLAALAGAVALFTVVARMDNVADGLLLMAGVLIVVVAALKVMSNMSPKVLISAAALMIFSVSLLVLAGALAAFAKVSEMKSAWSGVALLAGALLLIVAALVVLSKVALGALVGAAALLVVSAALLVLAGALAAFSAIAGMDTFETGIAAMALMLIILVGALIALGATGPVVIAGAAALLVAAAACVVLAIAVAAVSLVLPLLGAGLMALGAGIGSAVASIGAGVGDFLTNVAGGIEAAGAALGQMVSEIGSGIGEAVSALGQGVGEAITSIISSVGEGIGQGITAISNAVGTFGENLTLAAGGISALGTSVRSLEGISWTTTALGIGELSVALKKLKPGDLANNLGTAANSIITACVTMVTEINGLSAAITLFGTSITVELSSGILSGASNITSAMATIKTRVQNTASGISASMPQYGRNIASGIANGLNSGTGLVVSAMYNMAYQMKEELKKVWGIHSPSTVGEELAGWIPIGMAKGIEGNTYSVTDSISEMADGMITAISPALDVFTALADGTYDSAPSIRPVMDLSSAKNAVDSVNFAPFGVNSTVNHRIDGITSAAITSNRNYTNDLQQLIAINKELLESSKAGGNVYLSDGAIAGMVNRRLGVL